MRTRLLIGRARENRSTLTKEERLLWYHLRYSQLGVRFRRQHPIGPYIVDFACISHRLVVEADGGQHADSIYDQIRDLYLRQKGWTVLRFWNLEILTNLEGVLGTIVGTLEQASGSPSPRE